MRLFVSALSSLAHTANSAACSENCDAATLTANIVNNGPSEFTVECDETQTQEGEQENDLYTEKLFRSVYKGVLLVRTIFGKNYLQS